MTFIVGQLSITLFKNMCKIMHRSQTLRSTETNYLHGETFSIEISECEKNED